jgi:glycosyltransferase involved in cell wall biosynthesis
MFHVKQFINIFMPGDADPCDSYGYLGLELARHLTRMGYYVNVIPQRNRYMPGQDVELVAILDNPPRMGAGGIVLGWPPNYKLFNIPPGPRLAINMFETTKLPLGWAGAMNECNAVVTPSVFCRDVFITNGVTVPIHVSPLGVGELYQYVERKADRPLTFLAFMDRGKRKGWWTAARAFVAAFGDSSDHRLILKGRGSQLPMTMTNPNITTIERDMMPDELYELYLSADVLINPHRGEGFGLLPREFSATGGISVTTAWSGTAEGVEEWGVPIDYKLVPARHDEMQLDGQDLGMWAEPDFNHLVSILREIDDCRGSYRQRARVAAQRVSEMYRWDRFAASIEKVWSEL